MRSKLFTLVVIGLLLNAAVSSNVWESISQFVPVEVTNTISSHSPQRLVENFRSKVITAFNVSGLDLTH